MNSTGRVVVAGGGVLGMMHALAARRRGFEVVDLEREPDSRGASVRNFGLVWVSGRAAGAELDLALRARQRWEEIAGVLTGAACREDLERAGATHVLDTVAGLPALLGASAPGL